MNQPAPAPSHLPEALRPGLALYARRVQEVARDRLESLVIFGTVLTPNWRPDRPIHQAIVLTGDDLAVISRLGTLSAEAGKLGLAAPLLVTSRLVQSSLDTFPLEWLEISSCHEVLVGAEIFRDLVFTPEHVRLQCERESTVLAIAIRQRLLSGTAATKDLSDLAEQTVRILRGLLHLAGGALPVAPTAIIAAATQRLGIDLQAVERAWNGASGVEAVTTLHSALVALGERSDHG